jgi:hypothetical protein
VVSWWWDGKRLSATPHWYVSRNATRPAPTHAICASITSARTWSGDDRSEDAASLPAQWPKKPGGTRPARRVSRGANWGLGSLVDQPGPWRRLTVSKSGVALSAGVPGARVSVNTAGQIRETLGIPGSGSVGLGRTGCGRPAGRPGPTPPGPRSPPRRAGSPARERPSSMLRWPEATARRSGPWPSVAATSPWPNAPTVMAALRNLAIGVLSRAGPVNVAAALRRHARDPTPTPGHAGDQPRMNRHHDTTTGPGLPPRVLAAVACATGRRCAHVVDRAGE